MSTPMKKRHAISVWAAGAGRCFSQENTHTILKETRIVSKDLRLGAGAGGHQGLSSERIMHLDSRESRSAAGSPAAAGGDDGARHGPIASDSRLLHLLCSAAFCSCSALQLQFSAAFSSCSALQQQPAAAENQESGSFPKINCKISIASRIRIFSWSRRLLQRRIARAVQARGRFFQFVHAGK